jgi:hypothetical protein
MKPIAIPAAVVGGTFLSLALLFAVQPFHLVNQALDRFFGALPEWTQVENMYRDPATQEVTHGDHPLESFRLLESSWAAHPGAPRIMLMGNSQTQMTSLAPGEPPPRGPEKTYTDQIAGFYHRNADSRLFYRLSAGALSYDEMLWYATYLALHPEIKPGVLLIQLNYQNFANTGIRAGMLELLSGRDFREKAAALAASGRPYSGAFAEAIHLYDDAMRKSARADDAPPPSPGFGLETAVRAELDLIPGFSRRNAFRADFIYLLYRCRTYILRLQPATRRSLGGPRIQASRDALEDTVALAGRSGIRVILFEAPTNPAVPLYRTAEDERGYHAFTASLASRYRVPLFDFERSIPQNLWGMSLNVPDPLHLGREAHRRFAALMLARLEEDGF